MKLFEKKKYEDQIVPYVLVFLACINIFEGGAILWLLYTALSLVQYVMKRHEPWKIDSTMLLCTLFSLAAFTASFMWFGVNEIIKSLLVFLSCVAGYCNFHHASNRSTYIKRIVAVIFAAYFTQIFLIYVYNYISGQTPEGQRLVYSMWTKAPLSVTLVALLSSVIMAYSGYLIVGKNSTKNRLVGCLGLLMVVLINSKTATRTPFVLMLLMFALAFVYVWRQSKFSTRLAILISAVGVLLIGLFVWGTDLGGFRTAIQGSPLYIRFMTSGLSTGRTRILAEHASAMFTHLLGGGKISEQYGYAHNFVQEAHDLYGIIALIAIVMLLISFIVTYIRFFRMKERDKVIDLFFFLYSAIIPQLLLEPIFEGYPLLLWNFILIHTMANAYLLTLKKRPQPVGQG